MFIAAIEEYAESIRKEYIQNLKRLVDIDSSKGEKEKNFPYGRGPANALHEALKIAEELGLVIDNWENYLGSVQIEEFSRTISRQLDILCHLDVVPGGEFWSETEPFDMKLREGKLYGRGVADNKGAALAMIYALAGVKKIGFNSDKKIRLVLGCDEECGSSDLIYYFDNTDVANVTLSPDAYFPIVTVEKGQFWGDLTYICKAGKSEKHLIEIKGGSKRNIVPSYAYAIVKDVPYNEINNCIKIIEKETSLETKIDIISANCLKINVFGNAAHAMEPEKGNNAVTGLLMLLYQIVSISDEEKHMLNGLTYFFPHNDFSGKNIGIDRYDEISGTLKISLNVIRYIDGKLYAEFDARTPLSANRDFLMRSVDIFKEKGFQLCAEIKEPHYVDEKSSLVQTLLRIYECWTGEKGYCIHMGAGTYVHGINNGIAFGCCNPNVNNNIHNADEFISVDHLILTMKIYMQTIMELCK